MYDSSLSFDKLHSIDLNSILFFLAYMRCRKVSSAGAALNCSSATVSIMLNRFCDYFGEPIFERKTRTLTPTALAFELHEKFEIIMCDINNIFLKTSPSPLLLNGNQSEDEKVSTI